MIRTRDFIYRIKEDDSADLEHNIFFEAKPIGELIRCKDCKWWDKVDNIDGVNYGTCERKCTAIRKDAFLNENWFCVDGEKVTE